MSEPGADLSIEQHCKAAALSLGSLVTGRELTAEESVAMTAIFKAAAGALREGFIQRLADHVLAERDTERVEEFFEDVIKPD